MARLTYRKSVKVAPGVRLNVTHKGVRSISAGAKGLRLTQDLHNDRSRTRQRAAAPSMAVAPAAKSRKLMWMWIWTALLFFGSFTAPPAFLVSIPMLVIAILWSLAAAAPKPATDEG